MSEKDVFQPSIGELLASYEWGQVFQHETRVAILMYLRMNKQLSFQELVQLLEKSPSTVHHHLQILIKGGIVREITEAEPHKQFEPKHYELTRHPFPAYSFHNIHELPSEYQRDAFLITTKLHQISLLFLYQAADLFKKYLDSIEKELLTNKNLDPNKLKKIWTESLIPSAGKTSEIPFKEIFYFGTQVSDLVYSQYRAELERFHEKLVKMIRKEQESHENIPKPFFIFHIAAPLGKPYQSDHKLDYDLKGME